MISRLIALALLIVLSPFFLLIGLAIVVSDGCPVFFRQVRMGKDNSQFNMYKFRTMRKETPDLPTHLLKNPEQYLLPVGKILRRFSLDELPNLINILKGEMNFIGPRPALYNQDDLIELRTRVDVHTIKPGITGWAQVNGRDEIPIPKKVELDQFYLNNKCFQLDIRILVLTFFKSLRGKDVVH